MSDTVQTSNPIAYVLMRNDIPSLGAGKAAAHAHHAGTVMSYVIRNESGPEVYAEFSEWEKQANGAGTCIVLQIDNEEQMKAIVCAINRSENKKIAAGVWEDPSFPSQTSFGFFEMKMAVCAWVFGDKADLEPFLTGLKLMDNTRW